MENPHYKFSTFELLVVPYCYLVAWALSALVEQFTETTTHAYPVLFAIALLTSYPIFVKRRASYWRWIGKWTFMKFFVGVVLTLAVTSLLIGLII